MINVPCDKKPVRADIEYRCELRKNHKGMCSRTIVVSWHGEDENAQHD
jgi:hypothetical protein